MTQEKKQYRNQPSIIKLASNNNLMYFFMGVAIWRDERLNRNQRAILGQILSHNLDGDKPYIINKKSILKQLRFSPDNKNTHWNELVELGYLRYEKIGSGGRWIIDETKAKDSKWYKEKHPELSFSEETFNDINSESGAEDIESEGVENKGAENNGVQNRALSSHKGKEEQYTEAPNEESFSFSQGDSGLDPENPLNIEGGPFDETNRFITKDVYGNPLTEEEIMKTNNIDYESIPKN